ncbi:hypothetical protein ILUMI_13187, partial [Ignelater luminosus]
MAKTLKSRSHNFTEFEKHLMFEIVRNKYLHIVDNKKTDAVNIEQKNVAWEHIANEYNCQAQTGPRTSKQLRALYDILKKNARSNLNEDKKNFYKTGGGTYVPRSSILDEKIVCTLGAQFQPLTNNFDSSADYPSETFFTTGTGAKSTSTPQKSVQEESNCSFLANVPSSTLQQSTSSHGQKRKLSKIPEKKKTQLEILTNRVVKRKILKDQYDEQTQKQKMKILKIEEEIKKSQLEVIKQEIQNNKVLHEMEIAIKQKELEAKFAIMRWNSEERAFAVEAYFSSGCSVIATQRAFRNRFNLAPLAPVPDRKSIVTWVTTFRQTASATKRRTGVPRPVRSPENIEA